MAKDFLPYSSRLCAHEVHPSKGSDNGGPANDGLQRGSLSMLVGTPSPRNRNLRIVEC
jgi:hypothetical protein